MELILPVKLNASTPITVETHVLVVIGANGAGKSSFGSDLQVRYEGRVVKISGMRALFVLQEGASQYDMLINRLRDEEFEEAVAYKERRKQNPGLSYPTTKIDRVQQIWDKVFSQNPLVGETGFTGMSDGERIVFYLIGAIICAPENALLIVEEPEILLHNSIKKPLWDEIENIRPDCTFVYLTHDIDFAASRKESERVWVRSCDTSCGVWDYELIRSDDTFPEGLYLEILGSRKPILFIEGTEANSIDNQLYPLIFPDYTVKPLGGCQKVIETTKAFAQLKYYHMLDSQGIVDRDRRTEGEVGYLREQHILVPDVAEVENLLMLEPVIKTVAIRLMKDADAVFSQVKENVIRLFEKDLDAQVILHAKHLVRKRLETTVDRKITSMEELNAHVENIRTKIDVPAIYGSLKEQFTGYMEACDYKNILRVYNQKGILPQCRLCALCGVNNKISYLNLILAILKENKEDAVAIRNAIKESLGV